MFDQFFILMILDYLCQNTNEYRNHIESIKLNIIFVIQFKFLMEMKGEGKFER